MKIMVYEARPDERADLEKQAALHGVELSVTDAVPTLENASLAAGCIGVSILGQGCIDAALLDAYHALGIRYLSTRTIGYDHIDLDHARSIGLRVCSASYAPNGVADFTVMMILMCLRHYKQALWRGQVNDFSLTGLQGREMKDLTIGIIGTGRIGAQVARNLSGFGCRILAYDPSGPVGCHHPPHASAGLQPPHHQPGIHRQNAGRRGNRQLFPRRAGGYRGPD